MQVVSTEHAELRKTILPILFILFILFVLSERHPVILSFGVLLRFDVLAWRGYLLFRLAVSP
jgi:hypothetical protein